MSGPTLVQTARTLIAEAMRDHIYNGQDGEKPGPDCAYAKFLVEADAYLTFKASEQEIARARVLYADRSDDNVAVDDDAMTSPTDDGTWVQAWVWLPAEEGG
jgi:hypothetical protein